MSQGFQVELETHPLGLGTRSDGTTGVRAE